MSANYPQLPAAPDAGLPAPVDDYALATPGGYQPPLPDVGSEGGGGASLARFAAALKRYSWLVGLTTVLGLAGGITATRFINPEYQVYATVVSTGAGESVRGGPISQGTLTANAGWRDLLKTYAISDSVVLDLGLYLTPKKAADSLLFTNFRLADRFIPGEYTLHTEQGRFTLNDKLGFVNEQGVVGDSVGRGQIGFRWVPSPRLLGTKSRTVDFKVVQPREASIDIQQRFIVGITDGSPVIQLQLRGTAAQRPAATLNAMLERFVTLASNLKRAKVTQQAAALRSQLDSAQLRLQAAERGLETYRIGAITKPSENAVELRAAGTTSPGAASSPAGPVAGLEVTQPAISAFFSNKTEYEAIHRDRLELEHIAQGLRTSSPGQTPEMILSVPTVSHDAGSIALQGTVKELGDQQAALRKMLQTVTDSVPEVKDLKRTIADIRGRILPARLDEYTAALRARERELGGQVATATRELEEIPTRTIQQGKLERERLVQQGLYMQLQSSYAEATLAEQATIPDVRILSNAVTPFDPVENTAPKLIGGGIVVGLGIGLALALLLDRLDRRFRYPEQARNDLGLEVLGIVPALEQEGRRSPESVALIVESFRSIRMNVRYSSVAPRGIALGITSPGAGDGKSVVASNLALSFAEGGWRTVLIDADTRRGQLNVTFDVANTPGLVEYLEGTSLLAEVLQPTRHDNLSVIACGTRHRRAPELLATPRMQQLVAALASDFDCVIIDTPPLGAGTDAYAVGAACGQLAVVLRANCTNLKMAKAKLAVVRQLPIHLLGAILNEVKTDTSAYEYYSYDPDYVLAEETPALAEGERGTAVEVHSG